MMRTMLVIPFYFFVCVYFKVKCSCFSVYAECSVFSCFLISCHFYTLTVVVELSFKLPGLQRNSFPSTLLRLIIYFLSFFLE